MMDNVLEVVAFVALGVGIAMLSYRHLAPALHRTMRIVRFRRNLASFDDVMATWESVYRAEVTDPDQPVEPPRPGRRHRPEGF